jgi:hypothetical protein
MNYSWIKTRFETWITRIDVRGVCLFNLQYLITQMAYLILNGYQISKSSILFFISRYTDYLCQVGSGNVIRSKWWLIVNVCSTWSMVQLKTRFSTWIIRNEVYGICLMHLSYLITFMAYLCSQSASIFQIKCFMFAWTIYRLFVLNRAGNVILSKNGIYMFARNEA